MTTPRPPRLPMVLAAAALLVGALPGSVARAADPPAGRPGAAKGPASAKVADDDDEDSGDLKITEDDLRKAEDEAKKKRAAQAKDGKSPVKDPAAAAAAAIEAATQKPVAPVGPAAPPAAPEVLPDPSTINVEQRLDAALEHFYAKRHARAAGALYDLYRILPETELKRDTVGFYLAESLGALGFHEGEIEHHLDIINGRRTPDLVVRSLAALDQLVRAGRLDEWRLLQEVLLGNQFGDLPPEVAEFVDYYQGIGELRRGFANLGVRRLEDLGRGTAYYAWRARYALAVEKLARKGERPLDEAAEKILADIVAATAAPRDVRNDARTALARQLYEQKRYDEAFDLYSQNDSPLTSQDVILVEKAWAKVGSSDEQRALGMVLGLGAPVYRLAFSPERYLIRAAALDRLCQFRAAHLAVADFRRSFESSLRRIREHRPLIDDPVLRPAAFARADLLPTAAWRTRLEGERRHLAEVTPVTLRGHLQTIYDTRLGQAQAGLSRTLDRALDAAADDLLTIDEQMTVLDYEIGVGLFKGVSSESRGRGAARMPPIPYGGAEVWYRFDDEYWSDEIRDYAVRAEDRCLR